MNLLIGVSTFHKNGQYAIIACKQNHHIDWFQVCSKIITFVASHSYMSERGGSIDRFIFVTKLNHKQQ